MVVVCNALRDVFVHIFFGAISLPQIPKNGISTLGGQGMTAFFIFLSETSSSSLVSPDLVRATNLCF